MKNVKKTTNRITNEGIIRMDNTELLILLEQMKLDLNVKNSADSLSWAAHRKAEKLNDFTLFPMLCDLILENEGNKHKELRRNIYFVMGCLLRKKMIVTYCQYLIDRLGIETDKYTLALILNQIARLSIPREVNMDYVIKCSKNDKWLVRHSAITALRASDSESCREAARYWVKQVDEKIYKYEIIYANACLNEIGVMEDIELLDIHTHSRIRDIKDSALYAIEAIKRRCVAN
jgi:hypothetical protein